VCSSDLESDGESPSQKNGITLSLPWGESKVVSKAGLQLENNNKPTKNLALMEATLQEIINVLSKEKHEHNQGFFIPEISERLTTALDVRQVQRYVNVLRKLGLVSYSKALGFYLSQEVPTIRHYRSVPLLNS